eukprot:gene17381-11543_t
MHRLARHGAAELRAPAAALAARLAAPWGTDAAAGGPGN